MDRIASLTSTAKEKRLSIGVDTEDSVEDYDEDMDEDEGGWSDDEDAADGTNEPEVGADGTPVHGGSGSAKRRKSARPGSVRASPLASANRVARTEDEAVALLLAVSSGQTTIDLDPSIDKETVRRRVEEERERLRREAEGQAVDATTSGVSESLSSSSTSASNASAHSSGAASAVNYQETDLFKKLQAMRASAETASDGSAATTTGATVVSPRTTIDMPSALPALKITADVDPAAVAPVRRKESTVVSPRDSKAEKKDKKKKDKADKKDKAEKDKAIKSPREKKGVLASLLGK